jgi:hypothetical protein
MDNIFDIENNTTNLNNIYIIIFLITITSLIYFDQHSTVFASESLKLILFISIIYISSINIIAGIMIAFLVLILSQKYISDNIQKETEKENFEQYLTNPLQTSDELENINNIDLSLETPNEKYIKLMKKGKELVNKSYDLQDELIKKYDRNLEKIANETYSKGYNFIQSGLNQIENVNTSSKNIRITHISNKNG